MLDCLGLKMWGSAGSRLFQNVTNLTNNLTNAAVNLLDPDAEVGTQDFH